MKNDPVAIITQYIEKQNLRVVDFFNSFDKNKNLKICAEEFKRGVKVSATIGKTGRKKRIYDT